MKVLALSPHTDDVELCAGATIARLVEEGHEVTCIALSAPLEELIHEFYNAMETLGVRDRAIWHFPTRRFPEYRQRILQNLFDLKEHNFGLILVPSTHDIHQDHKVVCEEAIRAFKASASIWGYEHPYNNLHFSFDIFVQISKKHLRKKFEALQQYSSQHKRPYFDMKYLESLAKVNGIRCGCEIAECFELIREIRTL